MPASIEGDTSWIFEKFGSDAGTERLFLPGVDKTRFAYVEREGHEKEYHTASADYRRCIDALMPYLDKPMPSKVGLLAAALPSSALPEHYSLTINYRGPNGDRLGFLPVHANLLVHRHERKEGLQDSLSEVILSTDAGMLRMDVEYRISAPDLHIIPLRMRGTDDLKQFWIGHVLFERQENAVAVKNSPLPYTPEEARQAFSAAERIYHSLLASFGNQYLEGIAGIRRQSSIFESFTRFH